VRKRRRNRAFVRSTALADPVGERVS